MKLPQLLLAVSAVFAFCRCSTTETYDKAHGTEKIVVAYVTSWTDIIPNPHDMTHINYAFAHVNGTFNGIRIDKEVRLRQIVALKKKNRSLKVLLSIGGWGSGGFSEMAANPQLRRSFAQDCKRVVKQYHLDGIDIDWEYPTCDAANISASPDDTDNYTLLMQEIRTSIGKKKLLTLASVASAKFIDFAAIVDVVDFVNIMSYDMATAPKHQSALYPSSISGYLTTDKALKLHLEAGLPPSKLVLGMPFFGRGEAKNIPYRRIETGDFSVHWNDTSKVPYLSDKDRILVLGYENPRSLAFKCQYIIDNGLLGGMYWEYGEDNETGDLNRTVRECLLTKKKENTYQ